MKEEKTMSNENKHKETGAPASELSDLVCGDKSLKVVFVRGVEGPSIYINDHRICGNKPWGGGDVIHTWTATAKDILEAIGVKS